MTIRQTRAVRNPIRAGSGLALLAALAFGASTPFIQRFGAGMGPFTTAGLLYAGAAMVSLGPALRRSGKEAPVRRTHLPRLFAAATLGSWIGPACLAWGLQRVSGTGASLLLNLEAVFTVLLAHLLFREPLGRRVALAVAVMTLGGGLLVLEGSITSPAAPWGLVAVGAATLAWALDNVVSRPLADLNPARVVLVKASLGALLSFAASLALREARPGVTSAALIACGAVGYGLSLRLYMLAQRSLGAARTGSVFAFAPFVGAVIAWGLGQGTAGPFTLCAGLLLGTGILLHATELHEHRHTHEPVDHEHAYLHDDGHHDHLHDEGIDGEHNHRHRHDDRSHEHAHGPDAHHSHSHG